MADFYVGFVLITLFAFLCFVSALWLSRQIPRKVSDVLTLLVVVGLGFYIRYVWYDVRLAAWLPYSNLVVIGNWLPLIAGVLGGLAWSRIPGRFVRKALSVSSLGATAIYAVISPALGDPPECKENWDVDGVCIQTTDNTCTPACAATLLRMHGIDATEAEMAELCLTRDGTTWMGLYRGLKQKTVGSRWDVEIVECNVSELLALGNAPVILSVGIGDDLSEREQPRYAEWGWRPGQGHSVLLIGRPALGGFQVADPAPGYGLENWDTESLEVLFQGTAARLVERS
ncbi:MAG: hypothetical protein CMJ64_19890 [Planctomycetaceae bacterium]|jgi:hypothetical protein|nr:hypothetical protein [Planctomycetaceae bacterium]